MKKAFKITGIILLFLVGVCLIGLLGMVGLSPENVGQMGILWGIIVFFIYESKFLNPTINKRK